MHYDVDMLISLSLFLSLLRFFILLFHYTILYYIYITLSQYRDLYDLYK